MAFRGSTGHKEVFYSIGSFFLSQAIISSVCNVNDYSSKKKSNVSLNFENQIKYKNTCHVQFEAVETVNAIFTVSLSIAYI